MSETHDPFKESWEAFVTRMLTTPTKKEKSLKGVALFDVSIPHPPEYYDYTEKRQALAESLLFIATGYSWEDAEGLDSLHANYLADADDVLRQHPHLLGLGTREMLGLWDEKESEVLSPYSEKDAELTQAYYEQVLASEESSDEETYSDAPQEEAVKPKPSELPVNTLIDDAEHNVYLKDGPGVWFEVTNFATGKLVYDEGPNPQDRLILGLKNEIVDTPADEFFKDFEILAAPLGWEPPNVSYETMAFYSHESGKMERYALSVTKGERKSSK